MRGVLLHHFIKLRVSHAVHTIDEPFIFFIGDTDSPRSVKVYTRQCVFFAQICDYFGITPSQFFEVSSENPALLQTAIDELKKLGDDDLVMIISVLRRLNKK